MRGGFPAGNPLANILVIIAGILLVGASIVLGFFAFLALSAIVLVSAAIIGVRVWWLNRKIGKGQEQAKRKPHKQAGVIEGEYRVVSKDRDEA
ncbi:MAG: hypothetical protein GTO71_00535 [Woeseiaceae bacterium]|nr:hypothetical protein [Woeseiaceae bacterium]NIP19607.1 hypothetical protein [Woeseiaceae bacterium]NIS89724.1 hypothetical protein [Woeseiaceae bacterium]